MTTEWDDSVIIMGCKWDKSVIRVGWQLDFGKSWLRRDDVDEISHQSTTKKHEVAGNQLELSPRDSA